MNTINVNVEVLSVGVAFIAALVWTRKAGGSGGVDGAYVFGKATFLCEAFATNLARVCRRVHQVDSVDVLLEAKIPCVAFVAYGTEVSTRGNRMMGVLSKFAFLCRGGVRVESIYVSG